MSFYKSQLIMRQKIEKTIKAETNNNGGVNENQLICGVLLECPVSKKSAKEFVESLKDSGYVQCKDGVLKWV